MDYIKEGTPKNPEKLTRVKSLFTLAEDIRKMMTRKVGNISAGDPKTEKPFDNLKEFTGSIEYGHFALEITPKSTIEPGSNSKVFKIHTKDKVLNIPSITFQYNEGWEGGEPPEGVNYYHIKLQLAKTDQDEFGNDFIVYQVSERGDLSLLKDEAGVRTRTPVVNNEDVVPAIAALVLFRSEISSVAYRTSISQT